MKILADLHPAKGEGRLHPLAFDVGNVAAARLEGFNLCRIAIQAQYLKASFGAGEQ